MSRRVVAGWCTAAAFAGAACTVPAANAAPADRGAAGSNCRGTVYLTFDTGTMASAETIAGALQRHQVRATFFVANERTEQGGWSLGDEWAPFWRARVAEGHAFGTHTYDHVYVRPGPAITVRPQFGAAAGRTMRWSAAEYCAELRRADERFAQLTGHRLDSIWRAPAGRTTGATLDAARTCGYGRHWGWSDAGFLGDELPSDRYPNSALLERALERIRDGDVLMAHLGIRSRAQPFAPAIEPLIEGLRARGLCFATLRDHPDFGT